MRSTAHTLLGFPIWRGQRIFDPEHAKRLKNSIDDVRNLDSDYHIIVKRELHADGITMVEHREVVGGQHRLSILREEKDFLRLPDFPVTYTEKLVESEAEAEAYFNKVSSSKPMHFDEDPSLMVGRFIVALEKEFTTAKKADMCVRHSKTTRPFLFIEDIRPLLLEKVDKLRRTKPVDFAKRVWAWNRAKVLEMEMTIANGGAPPMMVKCHSRNFALAYDTKFPWILACL
jgi:hypothetical protein